jgi:hypothetical protein
MAVNPQRLLPPSKTGGAITKIASPGKLSTNKTSAIIKVKVIDISKILKGSVAVDKKLLDEKKREEGEERKAEQEDKLESDLKDKSGKIPTPKNLPKLGFLEAIKRFIGNIILGYLAVRLIDHLPKLIPIVTGLAKLGDFLIDTGIGLFNGLATFVDWGYKAYDATRGFLKNFGGENFAKGFDKFIGAVDTALFLTTILAADLAAEATFGGGRGPGGGGGGFRQTGGRGGVGPGGGFKQTGALGDEFRQQGFNLWQQQAKGGILTNTGLRKAENDLMKRYFQRFGRDAFVERFGQEGLERLPGGMARSGLTKFGRRAFVGLLGKGGAKAILGTVRPLLKRLPIIGALIDFGLSVALGEDPGRAAFKAIGAGLLGSVGAAIGSVVPVAGNLIGGIIGGMAGDAIGATLYDMFFGGKKPQPKGKTQGKAGGGITRGGKAMGGVRRTIGGEKKKGKYKRVLAKKPSKTEIKGAPTDSNKKLGEDLDKTNYFGPILAISAKIAAKQEPTAKDYENVGLGLNLLISKGIEEGQLKGGLVAAFANGGMVDSEFLNAAERGSDISNWVAKTFQGEIESKVEKNLRMIRERQEIEQRKKEEDMKDNLEVTPGPGGTVTGGNADFWTLVAIASLESGTPQGRADVAQSIYNRLASGIYSGNTIKELIVSGNGRQYQPVGRAAKEFRAISDKESAINAVMVANKLSRPQAEKFINESASAIQNKDLQMSAAQFVGGRTDFWAVGLTPPADGVGYVVRHGHRFGWFVGPAAIAYGKKNPGPAKAPALGDIVVMGGTNIDLGKGYGSEGSKIAGELGRFMKKKGVVPGSIHRHPEHPPYSLSSGHSKGSLHYQGRAIDLGGYTREQGPILAAISEFNRLKGVKPVQLIHGGIDPKGHGDHVHVAYAKGGFARGLTKALLGERGVEFVLDTDTTRAMEDNFPGFLKALNAANYEGAINVLRNYADYESYGGGSEIVMVPVPVPTPVPIGGGSGRGLVLGGSSGAPNTISEHMYRNS